MSTIIRILDAATGGVLSETTHGKPHVRDVVSALVGLCGTTAWRNPVSAVMLLEPSEEELRGMPPDALADLRAKHGTPPRIPLRTWTDKTGADLAGRLEEQCDKLSTPEGITATIEGLAMELAMFGSLVAMYLVTVRHSEEDGQHLLKTTNTLRIMDKRLFENSAAMSHLRRSIANSVEFVQDKLGSDDAKQPESKLVGPNGELLT